MFDILLWQSILVVCMNITLFESQKLIIKSWRSNLTPAAVFIKYALFFREKENEELKQQKNLEHLVRQLQQELAERDKVIFWRFKA